jgi:RimJ/RimL family protein N-acetyltransferase
LEGRERKAVYFAGRRWDRLNYALIREDIINDGQTI